MNKFNALNYDEPTYPPREWNIKPSYSHFKSMTYSPKTSPVVSAIMGRIKYHVIDNGDVFVFSSGHRNQITCSLLGGFSKPRAEVNRLLDSGL